MTAAHWYLLAGLLLLATALMATRLQPLPVSTAMLYLAVGLALGPVGFGLLRYEVLAEARALEVLAELAVLVSLFSAGLKMRVPLSWAAWQVPLRLAFLSMAVTVALIAALGVWLLGLPLGAAILLGAVLAPTDPVLASDVQLEHPRHRHRLRFSLTAEAGLNDGTAFPFVMLGLGLLGLHDLGAGGWRWLAVDVAWATGAGLAIGALLGMLVARFVIFLRRRHQEALGRDEFIALGLLALAYGAALTAHTYGFLAAFAAGVAVRAVERKYSTGQASAEVGALRVSGQEHEAATDESTAPAYMAEAVLSFNEQIERLLEVLLVLLLGALLARAWPGAAELGFLAALFLLVRPASVLLGLAGAREPASRLAMQGWFGIRGIGSIYYLMFAINHGLAPELARQLAALTLPAIVASIFLHGISVTPLMQFYEKRRAGPAGTPCEGAPVAEERAGKKPD